MDEPTLDVELQPRRTTGVRRGTSTLRISNRSDQAVRVDVSAFDPSLTIDVDADPPDVVVPPHATAETTVEVTANHRSFVRPPRTVTFLVSAHAEDGRSAAVEGEFRQRRAWLASVVALATVAALVAATIGLVGGLGRADEDREPEIVNAGGDEVGSTTSLVPLPTAPETTAPATTAPAAAVAPPTVRDLIAYTATRDGISQIEVIRVDGSERFAVTSAPGQSFEPAWSPDKQRLAFTSCPHTCGGAGADFEVMVRTEDGALTNITRNPARDGGAAWSPDGSRIAFHSDRSGTYEIWVMNADGSEAKQVTALEARSVSPTWSPDGRRIAFTSDRGGNIDIYVANLDDGSITNLTASPGADSNPAWAPDGSRIAFDSDRLQTLDVFVVDAAGGIPRRVTTGLANESDPAWSPDGSRLVFVTNQRGSQDLATVDAAGGEARILTPDPITETAPAWG